MYNSGDAAEQVVRISLEGTEVALKLTGSAAKNIAAMLYAVWKNRDKNKTKGHQRLSAMLKSGKELKVFTVSEEHLKQFALEAKRYGVVYCALRGKERSADGKPMKNTKKTANKLPVPGKVRKGFRFYCAAVLSVALVLGCSVTAFAANDPIAVVNNLSDFIFGLIRAVGLILLGWGIVQVGLSFQSHDPSQRSNGFLTLAGGIVITFAKEILNLITG